MLKPLEQFICDTCGGIIEKPEDSYVEFIRESGDLAHSFNIVHHAPKSPYYEEDNSSRSKNCYQHTNEIGRSDSHLNDFLGTKGIAYITSFIDVGEYHIPEYDGVRFKNGREFATFIRRVQIPYFEEARHHFDKAIQDGLIDGQNELAIFDADFLKEICERYSNY